MKVVAKTTNSKVSDENADNSVDFQIPGQFKFVLRGQYGVTIAAMTILGIFVVERMYTLSMCLARGHNNQNQARNR